jgi:hypothetical protein
MKTILAAILIFGTVLYAFAGAPISVADSVRSLLDSGATVVVEYRAGSCFGCEQYELDLVSVKTSPLVATVFSIAESKSDGVVRTPIAAVALTARDGVRFDRLLDFYRALPPDCYCTTSYYVAFREATKKEPFFTIKDDTGETRDRYELLTFGEIIDRAKGAALESKRANQALVPTPASITPAAGAPVVPDTGAAHL